LVPVGCEDALHSSGTGTATRATTADTALRLGTYFGTPPELWLDLQSDYELRRARQATGKTIESQARARVA